MEARCANCNRIFTKKRKDKKYCGRNCKVSAKDKRTGRYYERAGRAYRVFLKESCENCGFVPIHSCQLDVDHIDGNHSNNHPSNLRTLCANCHRLKTFLNQDWKK